MDLLGTDLWSHPAAGLISGGEVVSLRAAMRWRSSIRRGRGGRQASMAGKGIGVAEKHFVTLLWTCLQKESSLSCIFMRGVKKSEPYRRIGAMREEARRWQRYGGRPRPGGERRLTASKAPCARERRQAKWALVDRGGVNQYPSHLSSFLAEKYRSSSLTPAEEGGARSWCVRQWTSSVLGTEKDSRLGAAMRQRVR